MLCIACNCYVVGALENNRYATSHYFSQAKHYIVSGGRLNPNYKQGRPVSAIQQPGMYLRYHRSRPAAVRKEQMKDLGVGRFVQVASLSLLWAGGGLWMPWLKGGGEGLVGCLLVVSYRLSVCLPRRAV